MRESCCVPAISRISYIFGGYASPEGPVTPGGRTN